MKKQNIIIIVLCVLLAAVIVLSVLGGIGPQDSLSGYTRSGDVPTVSPPNTIPDIGTPWDHSFPTTP